MIKKLLRIKRRAKTKKPRIKRQEVNEQRKLKKTWRRPRGKQSKLRRHEKARGSYPKTGYRSPRDVRGLESNGLQAIRVFTSSEAKKLNPKKHTMVIGASVGKKKRAEILKIAEEKRIKVSNPKL